MSARHGADAGRIQAAIDVNTTALAIDLPARLAEIDETRLRHDRLSKLRAQLVAATCDWPWTGASHGARST